MTPANVVGSAPEVWYSCAVIERLSASARRTPSVRPSAASRRPSLTISFKISRAVSQAPFTKMMDRDPAYLFVWAPTSFGWRDLLLEGTPAVYSPEDEGQILVEG